MSDELARFNQLEPSEAERQLYATFASPVWARRVASGRPYSDFAALLEACESTWAKLEPSDWLAAFAAHPRIGEKGGHASESSEREQSGVRVASSETVAALAEENRRYEERFGNVFLISASGRTADEILGELRRRMENDPAAELAVAADEHRKITRLRVERMLNVMTISTHVLDTARGRPAAGVSVTLSHRRPGGSWSALAKVVTDANGRAEVARGPIQGGDYRLEFGAAAYFKSMGTDGFYPEVSIVFAAAEGETHLHVPLLLSPFGYSTYKGQ